MTDNNGIIVSTEKQEVPTLLKRVMENGEINISNLSEVELEKYNKLNSSLCINDINSISSYGSELQTSMTKYSNDFLNAVRTSKCGEIGTLIDDLLTELGYVDISDFDERSPLVKFLTSIPIIRNLFKSLEKVVRKYDSIAKNVDDISKKIGAMRLLAVRDNNALQVMFDNNITYGTQIEELIIAGKIKLAEVNQKIEEMYASPDKYDSYQIHDVEMFKNNLERRLTDMLALRYVIKQSLPQIRTVQFNNIAIADKAQSIISTTIPVWRNQLSIAVALNNQKASIEAQRKISDTTNKILLKNAEILKTNSIYVARESERSVVDVETLRETTSKLIETLNEIKSIHLEASNNRKMTENELFKIEKQLETTMQKAIQ